MITHKLHQFIVKHVHSPVYRHNSYFGVHCIVKRPGGVMGVNWKHNYLQSYNLAQR